MISSWSGQIRLTAPAGGRLGVITDCEAKCAQSCTNARPFITCVEPCLRACGVTPADIGAKIGEIINAGTGPGTIFPTVPPVPNPVPTPGGGSTSSSSSSGVSPIVWVVGGLLAIGAAFFLGGSGRMRANP